MTETEAARHSCGFFVAQHGRKLPAGMWEHSCEQIAAIDARVRSTRSPDEDSWIGRLRSHLAALTAAAR